MKKNITLLMAFICWLQMLNAQNVGIGTKTPNNLFQIGNAPGFSGNHLAIGNGVQGMSFNQYSGTSTWYSSIGFSLMPNGGNGYVGIGTTAPTYNLDVHGTGNAQFNLTEGIGGQTALFSRYTNRFELQSSDAFEISVGGIDKRNLCVASNGYVGIGTSTPTNFLQVGTYTNANYGGNQLALGFGTNVTVMNQYAGYSNFLTNTPLNIQSTKDIYLMPNNGFGHVGINTNTPSAPLEVDNYAILSTAPYAYFYDDIPTNKNPGGGFKSTDGVIAPSVSIYASNNISAQEFDAYSDARIKDIKDVSNTANDLATINSIQVTDYTLKDKVRNGNKPFKKVIAQQVEQVYPQVVSRHVDFIPNVYQLTDKINKTDSGYILTFENGHHLSKDAKRIKLLAFGDNTMKQYNIVSLLSDKEILIDAPDLNGDKVFVYGEEVNDFRTVDYEGLTTLNISATQELSKIIKQQQVTIDEQSEKIKDFNKKLEALMNEIELLKKKN